MKVTFSGSRGLGSDDEVLYHAVAFDDLCLKVELGAPASTS